jgi:hypothetical protein
MKNKYLQTGGGKNWAFALLYAFKNHRIYRFYENQFRRYLRLHGYPNVKVTGEDAYLLKWKQLSNRIEPYSYRLYSHYLGNNPNIAPEDLVHSQFEASLNPMRFRSYYSDKNTYNLYIPAENLPRTIARRIHGSCLLDENYQSLDCSLTQSLLPYEKVILKPTIDTNSGAGVMLFVKKEENWCYVKDENIKLTEQFLYDFSDDFIVQECLVQHNSLAALNPTSINTLRVAAYRSVKDEVPHVLASIVRVGKSGEFVDNAHAGGRFIGIDVHTGKLHQTSFDQFGNAQSKWNNVNYATSQHIVPSWEQVKALVEKVTSRLYHVRLVAFDITVDSNGVPKLVELNVNGFAPWPFYYTGQDVFGEYTDEIIAYCKSRQKHPCSYRLMEC